MQSVEPLGSAEPRLKNTALTFNPNPNPRFYQTKVESYGINVTPEKIVPVDYILDFLTNHIWFLS